MGRFLINGGIKLEGSVEISSAKNSVLPIMAASILSDGIIELNNFPVIDDTRVMIKILSQLGCKITLNDKSLIIDSSNIFSFKMDKNLSSKLRSSIFLMGSLLSKFGKAKIYYPGGCKIGKRPIDLHIDSLKKCGVIFEIEDDTIFCFKEKNISSIVNLKYPSVGATENIILSSVFCNGTVKINNSAKEPEIIDLANFINKMGGKVKGAGSKTIIVEGVKKLHGCSYTPIKDRIETGTFVFASLISGKEVEIKGFDKNYNNFLLKKFLDNTCNNTVKDDIIYMKNFKDLKGFNLHTGPYPMFPTDLQAPALSLACVSNGNSTICENVFEDRFLHCNELKKMSADIIIKENKAYIKGVKNLSGANVEAKDLRGGAALVLAGLAAEGETIVNNISFIDRGYFEIEKKLQNLGAKIKRIN